MDVKTNLTPLLCGGMYKPWLAHAQYTPRVHKQILMERGIANTSRGL